MPCSHNLTPLSGEFALFPEIPCWCEVTEAEDGVLFRMENGKHNPRRFVVSKFEYF
jgi:hypothetical protein